MTTIPHVLLAQPAQLESDAAVKLAGRRAKRRRLMLLWLARLGFAVFIVGGWQLCTAEQWVDKFFFGQPSMIWDALVTLFTKGTEFGSIWDDIAVTLKEAVYGFFLGTAAGVVLGLLLGQNRFLSDVLSPYIKVLNAVPRIILGSIFLVAFGLGTFPKVLLAAVLVFFIVFFNAYQGVREVNPNLVANVRVLGASSLQVARHVTIPSALTWIIASLHTAFGFAIIGALVGEVLGSQRGMGLVITQAQNRFDPNTVFAGMAIMAVVTLVAEFLLTLLEKRVLAWRPPSHSESTAI
ncbi:ABC transporter permease [Jatrophihabitans cynanchi]|jgi:NitT/TauT family transport system permease protein|uniref:ABC transporter permease n=1 Tax=Jatrophihabitans cynanchi TaxID=2944128 RepID=A0ABY7K3L5_9ACTN|nr:ABC transporter permease [Jatrophihabitans sp. SB3-54]WAX58790.1 ABC transporter permease [Jatrophihabitans sp. SB3-54]